MQIGNREFDFSHQVYLMGILNVTPDSFSDGGRFLDPAVAVEQALKMQEEGAALIDIGGESSRPGAKPVSIEKERSRVIPVLKRVVTRLRIPVSVDTRKSAIASEAIAEGAAMINDISSLRYDFRMAEVVAQAGVPVILMHMRGEPETMQQGVAYLNVVSEVIHFLKSRIEIAVKIGIDRSRILADPGIGFGKEQEHNLSLLRHLPDFRALECPIVIGASRKSFIRRLLQLNDPLHPFVQTGSLAVAAIAAWNGASLIRAHDVRETSQVIRMVSALKS